MLSYTRTRLKISSRAFGVRLQILGQKSSIHTGEGNKSQFMQPCIKHGGGAVVIWSCISGSGVRDPVWDHLLNLLKLEPLYVNMYIHMYVPVWSMYCIGPSVGHSLSCHCVLNLYSNTNGKVCESWKHLCVENLLFLLFCEFCTFLSHFVPNFQYNIKT